MTVGTVPAAGTSPRSETGYPLAEFRPTTDSARSLTGDSAQFTAWRDGLLTEK